MVVAHSRRGNPEGRRHHWRDSDRASHWSHRLCHWNRFRCHRRRRTRLGRRRSWSQCDSFRFPKRCSTLEAESGGICIDLSATRAVHFLHQPNDQVFISLGSAFKCDLKEIAYSYSASTYLRRIDHLRVLLRANL